LDTIISQIRAKRYRDKLNQKDDSHIVAVFTNFFLTYIIFQTIVLFINTKILAGFLFGDFYTSLEHIQVGIVGRDPSRTIFSYPLPEWVLFLVIIISLSTLFSFLLSRYYVTSLKKVVVYSNCFFLGIFLVITILSTITLRLFH